MPAPTRRAHVRAALLLLLIVAQALIALPFGPKVTAKTISTPAAQREVDAWMRLAAPLGFTREGFEAAIIEGSRILVDGDRVYISPITRQFKQVALGQAWALFAVPTDTPRRLEVRGVTDTDRLLLYKRHDPEHQSLGSVFNYRRVRGIYDKGKRTGAYRRLFEWSAARMFQEDPSLQVVEMIQRERRVGAPWEDLPTSETTTLRHTIRRDELLDRRPDLFGQAP